MFVSLSIYISQKLKYMDILLVILGVICLLGGGGGFFWPFWRGPPVAYLALWLLHFTGYAEFTVTELVVWGLLVVLVQAMDYVTPMLGTKYSGGSKWGNWGCAVGTVVGIFVFPPWGILLGPFVGAFVGELLGGKASGDALKASFGAFAGFLLSVVLKVTLCGYFIYSFVRGIIN